MIDAIWRGLALIIALAVLIIFATHWTRWEGEAPSQTTDDAYLQADITPLSAKVAGYVRAVPVQDFDHVHAGQVLVEITDDDYRATVAQIEANVAAAKAQTEVLNAQQVLQAANIRAAEAVEQATSAAMAQNARDTRRQELLLRSGSSSQEAAERLATTAAQLSAQLAQNRAQIDAARGQLQVLAAQTSQSEATLAAQQASLRLAQINLAYTKITAPEDGVIGQRQVRPGQYLGVGGQITTLTPLPHLWVLANYKETQLTRMSPGQSASITVDTYPDHRLRGHVLAFAPASGSQFTLLPPDNATGNFTKIVQRVAVKISIDDFDGLADVLRPGLSVIATVDTSGGSK